jgi:hypothetical protein
MRTTFKFLLAIIYMFQLAHSQFITNHQQQNGTVHDLIDSSLYITLDQPDGLPDGIAYNNGGNYFETAPQHPVAGQSDGWYSSKSINNWNGSMRRISNLATTPLDGASANYKVILPDTGFYLVYVYMGMTSNSTDNAIFTIKSLPDESLIQEVRYSIKEISAGMKKFIEDGLISKYSSTGDGAWMPLIAFHNGAPNSEFLLSIGADSLTNVFLRADAVRLLRSDKPRNLEFGKRERINFGSNRTPELFPQTNLGETHVRSYPLWNLGIDTISITSIVGETKRFNCRTTLPLRIPPRSSLAVEIEFMPFEEEYVVDTITIVSNDSGEPVSTWVMAGEGVNYNFILNASDGSEPMWNVPGTNTSRYPSYTPPVYRELDSTWFNSVAAPAIYPIHFGNISSRVTRDTLHPLNECQFEFTIPIEQEGYYTIGYGGPVSSNASKNITAELITKATADTQRVTGFDANFPSNYSSDYKSISPIESPFYIKGNTRMLLRWYGKNTATSFVRIDLLRIHKIPVPAFPALTNTVLDFGVITISDTSEHNGPYAVKNISLKNNGEHLYRIKNVALKNGSTFAIQGSLQEYRDVPALGSIELPVALVSKTYGIHSDTLIIQTEGPDSTFTVIVKGSTLTDVHIKQSTVPTEFSLAQNYPNPFNPSTTIRFVVPVSGFVSLKVFDLLGREVATLVDEKKDAGSYEVTFDGKNLSSGVYFYRLQAGEFVQTKKLLLQK